MVVLGVFLGVAVACASLYVITARASVRVKPRYSWQYDAPRVDARSRSVWVRVTRWVFGT